MAATVQLVEKRSRWNTDGQDEPEYQIQECRQRHRRHQQPDGETRRRRRLLVQKWLRMNVSGGTYTEITNVKVYMDGANGLELALHSMPKRHRLSPRR